MHEVTVSVRDRTHTRLAWTLLVFKVLSESLRTVLRRRFAHAVDNFGDSAGFMVDWVVVKRRRRSHPPAAGRCGGRPDHKPRHRTQGRLIHLESVLSVVI